MNITVLSGSPRKNSNTLRVAKAIKRISLANGAENVDIIDFNEQDIPFLNQAEVDINNLTDFQSRLVNSMDKAHIVYVLTPEYNWFPTAELINMIHQMGNNDFKHIFNNKVFAFGGVSNGRGGRVPAIHLNNIFSKMFNVFSFESVAVARAFESQFTPKVLDEDGNSLGTEEYDKGLEKFVSYSESIAKRWFK